MPAVVVSIASASGRAIQKQKPKSNPPNSVDDARNPTFQMFCLFPCNISGNRHQVHSVYLSTLLSEPRPATAHDLTLAD